MIVAGLIAFLCIGLILGLIGGGGSILGVPVLVYIMGYSADMATTYSLFIVGLTSLIGALAYLRRGEISAEAIAQFALASTITVFCVRRYMMPAIPAEFELLGLSLTKQSIIMVVFSILIFFSSYSMIKKRKAKHHIRQIKWDEFSRSPLGLPFVVLLGISVGFITGFVGAGGGFIIVPVLMFFLRLKFKKAIGTSLCIIAINSLIGFTGNIGRQNIDWKFLLMLSALCALGILFGSLLSSKISAHKLKPAFGWFTLIVGLFVFVRETLF